MVTRSEFSNSYQTPLVKTAIFTEHQILHKSTTDTRIR